MGLLNKGAEKGIDVVRDVVGVIDQAVLDKDKAYELKVDLVKTFIGGMLTGKGSSVTKYTICGLVILVVGALTYAFMFNPDSIERAVQYALSVTPVIGILTGAYLTGTTVQTNQRRRDR